MHIGWPEGILIGMRVVTLLIHAAMHGEPRTGKWSFPLAFMDTLIVGGLLWWGGLFA